MEECIKNSSAAVDEEEFEAPDEEDFEASVLPLSSPALACLFEVTIAIKPAASFTQEVSYELRQVDDDATSVTSCKTFPEFSDDVLTKFAWRLESTSSRYLHLGSRVSTA